MNIDLTKNELLKIRDTIFDKVKKIFLRFFGIIMFGLIIIFAVITCIPFFIFVGSKMVDIYDYLFNDVLDWFFEED